MGEQVFVTGECTLHEDILRIALAREQKLIDGVDAADLETFLRIMRKNVGSI